MAHEPVLHAGGVGLGMELQGQLSRPGPEGLVGRDVRGGQQAGAGRQVEGIAVPVQHGGPAQGGQGRGFPGLRQVQAAPADLLGLAGIDGRAQGLRHELGAQADAQQGTAFGQTAADEFLFPRKEGVGRPVVDAHGAAQDDTQVGIEPVPCGGQPVRHMAGPYGPARFTEYGREGPEVFKIKMLQYKTAHMSLLSGRPAGRARPLRCSLSYTRKAGRERLAPPICF